MYESNSILFLYTYMNENNIVQKSLMFTLSDSNKLYWLLIITS